MLDLPAQAYRPPLEPGAPRRLPVTAGSRRRIWGAVIDDLLAVGPIFGAVLYARATSDGSGMPTEASMLVLAAAAWVPLCWFLNRLLLQSTTGRSVGRLVTGTRIVYVPTWEPPTIGQLFQREIQGSADQSIFSRGWERMDTHWLGQRYADQLSRTAVIRTNPPDVWDEDDPYGWGSG